MFIWVDFHSINVQFCCCLLFSLFYATPYVCDKSKGICSNFHFEIVTRWVKMLHILFQLKISCGSKWATEMKIKHHPNMRNTLHLIAKPFEEDDSKAFCSVTKNWTGVWLPFCVKVQKTTRLILCSLSLFAEFYQRNGSTTNRSNQQQMNEPTEY